MGLLGDKAWKKIINAASSGRIDGQQMKDLAYDLPTDRELDKIGARHVRRMKEKDRATLSAGQERPSFSTEKLSTKQRCRDKVIKIVG